MVYRINFLRGFLMDYFMIVLSFFLIFCAVAVSFTKKNLSAIVIFSAYSLVMTIIWIIMESPDLAITEAAVGAGVTSILFFATLKKINQIDIGAEGKSEDTKKLKPPVPRKIINVFNSFFKVISAVLVSALFVLILFTALNLPELGSILNPDNNEVARRYIESGIAETGAVNIVAGMILDYRAFDTFGESNVLFVATICVTVMLRLDSRKRRSDGSSEDEDKDRYYEPVHDTILQVGSMVLIPVILIFGIYVVLNGHLSPGGGFSGGAILGAGLILYLNAFGFEKTEKFMNAGTVKWITFGALMVYCLAKSYSFFTGANGLESHIPLGIPGAILSSGLILILNICVGMVVACTMYSFYALVRRGRI